MSRLILKSPFMITAGLCPGLQIGNAVLECRDQRSDFWIVGDGWEHQVTGYQPGVFHELQTCFDDILSFLQDWVSDMEAEDIGGMTPSEDPFFPDHPQLKLWCISNTLRIEELRYTFRVGVFVEHD